MFSASTVDWKRRVVHVLQRTSPPCSGPPDVHLNANALIAISHMQCTEPDHAMSVWSIAMSSAFTPPVLAGDADIVPAPSIGVVPVAAAASVDWSPMPPAALVSQKASWLAVLAPIVPGWDSGTVPVALLWQ